MGCHTWGYVPLLDYTEEQVYRMAEREMEELNDAGDVYYLEELAPGFAAGDWESIAILAESFAGNTYNLPHVSPRTKRLYIEVQEFELMQLGITRDNPAPLNASTGWPARPDVYSIHDPFRAYGYPEDELHLLEEATAFIESWQREDMPIAVNPNTRAYLVKFWKRHPQGIITFG